VHTSNPSYSRDRQEDHELEAFSGKDSGETLSQKQKQKQKGLGSVVQEIEYLYSMCKALGSIPSMAKKAK
jgi:hypothetical protein